MSKEAMKLALEALRKARRKILTTEECHATITFLNKALAKQEQGEPVAIPDCGEAGHDDGCCGNAQCLPSARRTTPQQRTWIGLTDDDLSVCDDDGVILARYWEAKLKKKNT